jgi:ABC-type transport system involved in Fe-S cluster assembly fused permease/ATPase subunit
MATINFLQYLFLWMIPALLECLVVCIIFATYFSYLPLAIAIFYFVFVYVVWTIVVTLWRKKFRKALVQSDNEMENRFVDSMINFETVKFFTAEDFEAKLFSQAVQEYQEGSVTVQASLSFLNISQQIILQLCLATALSLAAMGIKQRMDCCMNVMGCDSGVSECCRAVSVTTCPGMQVGDFVAVLSYTLNLFQPLNFLGSVYNAVVMAVIDLTNMSELLAESPDVTDAPDAIELPHKNIAKGDDDKDVAVEFDNVFFHYPTQPEANGLKGLSFKMKRGTTTAIVGPTGAGKTTVSRLFFRFYDVLGGAVKINGMDVRSVTQKSLRQNIGVVPQTASLFNDTIKSNLLYGRRDATHEELRQAAKDAQILGFIESLDEGWDSLVGDRGLKLSGGEKQRTAICRYE